MTMSGLDTSMALQTYIYNYDRR